MSNIESTGVGAKRPLWGRRMLIAIVVVFVGVIIYRLIIVQHGVPMIQPPQTVGVAVVTSGDMPETISALGTVTPTATVTIVPQLNGYLTAVGFKEGQDVVKGQFLAQIDPRPYEVQLEQYEAALAKDQASVAQAQSDLARYLRLEVQKSIAEQQVTDQKFVVEQDQAAEKADEANIASANLNLSYCHITAPVAGRVGLRLIDPGNYVTSSSSTGIVVITAMKPITVIFSIPQNELAAVLERFNAGAKLQVAAYSSDNTTKIATGAVSAIDNQMSITTGTVELRATFANENDALFPNEFVNVVLLVNTLTNATLVPTPAIQNGAPGSFVYAVNADHTVSLRKVVVGPSNGTETVIESGLRPGETVVTDGVDRLSDGAKVVVAPPRGTSPTALDSDLTKNYHRSDLQIKQHQSLGQQG